MSNILISTNETSKSEIIIENGISKNIKDFFENKNYFLITNTTLAKLYPEFVYSFNDDKVIVIKDGEKYKNQKTYNQIIEKLLAKKIERKDCIVALGGGVVGDLAGYVASTILRGVELIQVPTTLLAMCDSSIGGKTGYNTQFGKNLVGSFYFASKVIIDPEFLFTLNDYEYKCGLGEVLKYAFIEKSAQMPQSFDLLNFLEVNQVQDVKYEMKNIIEACAKIKANVVCLDKKEGGLRKILNFGHTFAHPIETLAKYKNISHGKAVSWGIAMASNLAKNIGKIDENYYKQIVSLLEKFELLDKKIKFPKNKIVDLMFQDKKVENKKINLLLPVGFAQVELFDNIDLPSIKDCLP
ncbi:MAG: 3-dehydroquinate synthase [Candidatus Gastranaerophilales bacterium]|nr:3-dehydroquinate synthase [Candidatus Gastranaerophilales bacterium]